MQPSETIGNGEDPVAGNVRRVRASAIAGALGRYDEASWPQSASRADGGGQGSVPGPPKPRNHSRLVGRLQHQNHETRAREHLAQAGERERMDHDLDGRVEDDPGVGGVYTAGGGGKRMGTSGSATSSHADRWDPAVRLVQVSFFNQSRRWDKILKPFPLDCANVG